ncbi:MAG: sensor domain-containing diguanylate cyclase [Sedimentibacter sp.]|uniref:sensor domain-containing diguanylate cyclase n=1 Tax=Sedimentibacter sp. TaxID=1960295 RepID=UPI003157F559
MIKNFKYKINLLVSAIIILGFVAIIIVNYNNYSKIIKDDIKNISKLTSTNIYSDINSELTKPIFVSLTMANDSFLKDWLLEENTMIDDEVHLLKLQNYLKGFEVKYGYNSVFLVSNKTKRYYHYAGILKTIDEKNAHDQWYFNFINDNKTNVLDVDNDEAANNTLTVFVNCRIQDENNVLMGVTGVGLEMNQIQTMLMSFEEDYGLEAFLIDENGLVQVHTTDSYIEKYNIFSDRSMKLLKDDIVNNKTTLETFPYKEAGIDGYLITRYIDDLGWYLVVKKDTSVLKKTFMSQLFDELLILIVVIGVVILIINSVIKRYGIQIAKMANTDSLTELLNRRGFDEALSSLFINFKANDSSMFVFDIDDFKIINDTYGHIFGDRVICLIASYACEIIGKKGIIARWGGDEFAGILQGNFEESKKITKLITEKISQDIELKKYKITISLGLTHVEKLDTANNLMVRADKALYEAKSNGKNQVYIL